MNLQKIQLPETDDTESRLMYVRGRNNRLFSDHLAVKRGGSVSFDTFYNFFSVEKWNRYTQFSDLWLVVEIKGHVVLELIQIYTRGIVTVSKKLHQVELDACERKRYRFLVPHKERKGNIYFRLAYMSDGSFYCGNFETDSRPVNRVKLAAVVCTFHREAYVRATIKLLQEEVFCNEKSPLNGSLKLFLIDNGQSGIYTKLSSDDIFVYENPNTGGSGGFSRGMLEVLRKRQEYPATHVILMDDDIKIKISSLECNFAFLCYLRKEYRYAFIGGSILQMGKPFVQEEFGGRFRFTGGFGIHHGRDLRNRKSVLTNDRGKQAGYIAWCYCCIPLWAIMERGLPLPLFLHHDDVEYAMRIADGCICLNGICVEHEARTGKWPSANAYYNVRNLLIVLALHKPYGYKWLLNIYILMKVGMNLYLGRYLDAGLNLEGVKDFLRGSAWLVGCSCMEKHALIREKGCHYEKRDADVRLLKRQEGYVTFKIGIDPLWKVCLHSRILYQNRNGEFLSIKKNKQNTKEILKQTVMELKEMNKEYRKIRADWQNAVSVLISENFWIAYLERQGRKLP